MFAIDGHDHQEVNAILVLKKDREYHMNNLKHMLVSKDNESRPEKVGEPTVDFGSREQHDGSVAKILRSTFLKTLEKSLSVMTNNKEIMMQYTMEMFKHICIIIPLLDTIKHIPAYAKFLKELCI